MAFNFLRISVTHIYRSYCFSVFIRET